MSWNYILILYLLYVFRLIIFEIYLDWGQILYLGNRYLLRMTVSGPSPVLWKCMYKSVKRLRNSWKINADYCAWLFWQSIQVECLEICSGCGLWLCVLKTNLGRKCWVSVQVKEFVNLVNLSLLEIYSGSSSLEIH